MTFINVEKECDRLDEMYSLGDMGRRERDGIAIFMQEIATPVDAIPVEWINKYTNEHRTYMHAFSEMVACWYDEKEKREYERASDMRDYCERYEPTYNPEDGSL